MYHKNSLRLDPRKITEAFIKSIPILAKICG